jgi:hypothetical protein
LGQKKCNTGLFVRRRMVNGKAARILKICACHSTVRQSPTEPHYLPSGASCPNGVRQRQTRKKHFRSRGVIQQHYHWTKNSILLLMGYTTTLSLNKKKHFAPYGVYHNAVIKPKIAFCSLWGIPQHWHWTKNSILLLMGHTTTLSLNQKKHFAPHGVNHNNAWWRQKSHFCSQGE